MGLLLTEEERSDLKRYHRAITVKKQSDKIKAILLLNNNYPYKKIAEILLIDEDTVRNWEKGFNKRENLTQWLATNYVGYKGKLTEQEKEVTSKYVENNIISDSKEIIEFIQNSFSKNYSTSGIVNMLKRLGFTYKMTKLIPSKYDEQAQKEFKAQYEQMKETLKEEEVLLFADGVHPQHNTKCSRAWIKIGQAKKIKSNTGRSRININGVYNPLNQDIIVHEAKTINAQTTIELFIKTELFYSNKTTIYMFADNARYYKNALIKHYLKTSRIKLIFLPAYSPNLNLIERLWKLMRKKVINSQYYEHFDDFKKAALSFFENCNENRPLLKNFIGDKMHLLSSA